MIEVQLFDKSFETINPNLILSMKSDVTKEVEDSSGNKYTVNDYIKGTKFTITFINGDTRELSKLGLDILRQQLHRADFVPSMYKNAIYGL